MRQIIEKGYCKGCCDLEGNIEYSSFVAKNTTNNLKTYDNRLTQLRKCWKKHCPPKDHSMINEILSLTSDERMKVMSKQNKRRTEALSNKIFIPEGQFDRAMDILMDSNKVADVIIALMMATGRRLIEILVVCRKPTEVKTDPFYTALDKVGSPRESVGFELNCIQFTDQAKLRKGTICKPFVVPLLNMGYDELSEYWDAMRSHVKAYCAKSSIPELCGAWGELTHDQKIKRNKCLTRHYATLIGNRLIGLKMDGVLSRGLDKSHQLRKWYAAECCHRLKPRHIDDTVFITRCLGHAEGSATCLHYKNVKIC